jgi:hypothetical protein
MMRDEKITASPLPQLHIGMIAGRHTRERCARFALAPGAQIKNAVGRQLRRFRFIEQRGKPLQISRLARGVGDAVHGAADKRHFAAMGAGRAGDGIEARDIGREGRDRHASLQRADQLGQALAHIGFGTGATLHQRIGGIADERQRAFVAEFRERADIRHFAQERIGIDLPVARVHDHAQRRTDRKRIGLEDRMGDRNEFDRERPELQLAAERHDLDAHLLGSTPLQSSLSSSRRAVNGVA